MENQQLKKGGSSRNLLIRTAIGIIAMALILIGAMEFTGASPSRQSSPAEIKAQEKFQRKLEAAQDECAQKTEAARKEAEQAK
jgi:hypothetical protein